MNGARAALVACRRRPTRASLRVGRLERPSDAQLGQGASSCRGPLAIPKGDPGSPSSSGERGGLFALGRARQGRRQVCLRLEAGPLTDLRGRQPTGPERAQDGRPACRKWAAWLHVDGRHLKFNATTIGRAAAIQQRVCKAAAIARATCTRPLCTIRRKYGYKFLCKAMQKCNRIFDAQRALHPLSQRARRPTSLASLAPPSQLRRRPSTQALDKDPYAPTGRHPQLDRPRAPTSRPPKALQLAGPISLGVDLHRACRCPGLARGPSCASNCAQLLPPPRVAGSRSAPGGPLIKLQAQLCRPGLK